MRLHAVLPRLQQHPSFRRLVDALGGDPAPPSTGRRGASRQPICLSAITPARPLALAALHAAVDRPTLVVTPRPGEARLIADELRVWSSDPSGVFLFPETDALPYDYLPNDPDKLADRLAALESLGRARADQPPIVVASSRAAIDLLTDPSAFRASHRTLRRGEAVAPNDLVEEWLRLGYEPSPLVDQPGLFSRRGGILDVFPPGGRALRLEFWGDEIDTIRAFDPATQRSTEQLDEAVVGAAHEVLPAQLGVSLDLEALRPQFRGPFERDQRLLREGQAFTTIEFYRGLLGSATLLDYLPNGGLLVLVDPSAIASATREFEEQVEQLQADLLDRGEIPPGIPAPYRRWMDAVRTAAARATPVHVLFDPDTDSLPFEHAPKFGGRVDTFLERVLDHRDAERTLVVSQQTSRLRELFEEQGSRVPEMAEPPAELPPVTLVHGLLREGWHSADLGLDLFTDSEIFGWTKQRRAGPSRRTAQDSSAARDAFIADLKPGDLVVHADHGIARYGGMIRTAIGHDPGEDTRPERAPPGHAEFLLLEYAEGDRLYVPVSQADRVSRYIGSGDAAPSLTRLGSGEWSRAKARVRRSVRDIARELMDLYATRETVQGHEFPTDTPWQVELEASFPFVETPDQLEAIHDVKADMQAARPMDRLIVGDVGFGKTEVALRAAFKAVQDGKQVGVLVPTTVLAQQHFNTFRDRLAPFPIRVEMLSRFRSDKEQRQVLEGLANGSVDICIGTHRLVQKDVHFKDLGLVIIDEEQRFGVAHKERLKELRKEVDVLTLTATPIPRTLHMGLVGVRDMSVLETPPEARLPVRTYVSEHDDGLIREAVLREIDRGGQVYFVHNRVQGIEVIASRIRKLVPDGRVLVGHGQMPEDQLEAAMLAFAEGECDVLVCTTIIESGLDIPNANTLIVNNADRFGLAQLYQLRGRVGRSSTRAYAYFLYTRDVQLSEEASERLKTIFEATELGAGMRIAMKDLEIRGAGNLLGAAQSGHIAAVGFDLYTKLLAEQVDLLKAHQRAGAGGALVLPADAAPTSVDLPLTAFIPPEYVADDAVRLRLYQRFSSVQDDRQLTALVSEVEDRFGSLPEPAQNLVYLTSLRLRAHDAGVEEVATTDGEVVVRFDRLPPLNLGRMEREIGVPLKLGSNQVRLPRGDGMAWMGRLYALVESLPSRG